MTLDYRGGRRIYRSNGTGDQSSLPVADKQVLSGEGPAFGITDQHVCEDLSRAYVQAVAAKARIILDFRSGHDYGIDGTFRQVQIIGGRRGPSGCPVDFQLKASTDWSLEADDIVYDLKVKNYNDLVRLNNNGQAAPALLIVLCLPPERSRWLRLTEECLLLKKCCYWDYLTGNPSNNVSTVRVRIARANRLTPEGIASLLDKVRQGSFP